jgi:hypothetical protein
LPQIERLEERCLLSAPAPQPLLSSYGQIPLSFEINKGQAALQVNFLSRGTGYGLFLAAGEAVLSLSKGTATAAPGDVVAMRLAGANADAVVTGLDPLAGTSNYLIGNDTSRWLTDIANYGQVEYQSVYPDVNLVYYGNQRNLEYDFQLAPGADPGVIQLAFTGVQTLSMDAQGNLLLETSGGEVVEKAPVVYQQDGNLRQAVAGRYVLEGGDRVGFAVGAYDASRPLVIDPILSYSTYFGGSGNDAGTGIAVDTAGNAYITGSTTSIDLPTGNPYQPVSGGGTDAFVAKLNASGTGLVYSTYLGGSGTDIGMGIAVDAAGNAFVTGNTQSSNFPTANPLQRAFGGSTDGFVAKLNATGSGLVYSTYLGGSSDDYGTGIAVDASGSAYVIGYTTSSNFPTANPGQAALSGPIDAFVAKLSPSGSAFVYSTYFGGGDVDYGESIAVDAAGDACFAGETYSNNFPVLNAFQSAYGGNADAFVAKLNPSGSALIYSTYLGGSNFDDATSVTLDAAGNAYITGQTNPGFPTANALQPVAGGGVDAFVTELSASGTTLIYSTFLGGASNDYGTGIAVDASGSAYVTGLTQSTNFPTANTPEATSGGGQDAFVAKLSTSGTALVYSTYLGGSGYEIGTGIAVDTSGSAYVTGLTQSTNFPLASPLQPGLNGAGDAFVSKIATAPLSVLGTPLAPVAAAPFTGTIAWFVANEAKASNFTALVSWGDNSSGPATLVPFSGGYNVVASHTYVAAGSYAVVVTVQDSNGDTATGTSLAKVLPSPLTGLAKTVQAVEASAASFVVAGFDVADPSAFPGRFTATIKWGDATTSSTGTVVADGPGFEVTGSHIYATHGTYGIIVTINDAAGGSATVKSTAVVDYPPLAGSPRYISVFGALTFSGVVATFSDPDLTQNPNRYQAVVTWPDTKTTTTVTPAATTTPGLFTISASHTFANFTGTLTLLVVVNDLQSPETTGGFRTVKIDSRVSDPPAAQLNQAYVAQLYRELLQRQPDAGGLAYWSGLLEQGTAPQQVAQEILASPEYRGVEVRQLYATYLHREPEPLGLAAFTQFLSAGGTAEQAAALILSSPEYRDRAGDSDPGFLDALYQDALGRAPDPTGRAAFSQALAQGVSRGQVAAIVLGSVEYQQGLVQSDYLRYLHRRADPVGLNGFTSALARGVTDEGVLAAVVGSAEYFADCQDRSGS